MNITMCHNPDCGTSCNVPDPHSQRDPFAKEGGEAVIDAHGNRIPRPTL